MPSEEISKDATITIAKLRKEIDDLREKATAKAKQIKQDMLNSLDQVVSARLKQAEEDIVETGADSLLSWFCNLQQEEMPWDGIPSESGVLSTARNAVNFY